MPHIKHIAQRAPAPGSAQAAAQPAVPQPALQPAQNFLNVSAYRFVELDNLPALRERVREQCAAAGLKGTVLLAPEGVNLFLAGVPAQLNAVLDWLRSDARFADLTAKESWSDHQPFNRMLVKLKKEIITMKHPQVRPGGGRAPHVDAATLKRWLDAGHDDAGREIALIDTRNEFEINIGTFEGAINPKISTFGEFPERIDALARKDQHAQQPALKGKTVVTFCTGGIRCEKAVLYMEEKGFENVYQLDGGILKYFETVGGRHFQGDCFVFDRRVALTSGLTEAGYAECFNCRAVVSPDELRSPQYVVGKSCPRCCASPPQAA